MFGPLVNGNGKKIKTTTSKDLQALLLREMALYLQEHPKLKEKLIKRAQRKLRGENA